VLKMTLYASTSCLKDKKDVFEVLDTYHKSGITNVELGIWKRPIEKLSKINNYDCNFIVHHYFPPPHDDFVVNLASQDKKILARSREQMKRSIDFCHRFHSKLFSFHAGFRADPDINFCFSKTGHSISYQKAFTTFVESVKEINTYAVQRGVKLAVENNVLSENNLVNGENKFFLLCEAIEFEQLWKNIQSDNLGILLDLGHLKVTSNWLNFDRHAFIERVREKIFAMHINDNNGRLDTHSPVDKTSWCLEAISRNNFAKIPIILESTGLTIDQITQQLRLIENVANYDATRETLSYG
jgi:sugar phosphate isomerase/epimerase